MSKKTTSTLADSSAISASLLQRAIQYGRKNIDWYNKAHEATRHPRRRLACVHVDFGASDKKKQITAAPSHVYGDFSRPFFTDVTGFQGSVITRKTVRYAGKKTAVEVVCNPKAEGFLVLVAEEGHDLKRNTEFSIPGALGKLDTICLKAVPVVARGSH
jgi:hypothetical protein